MNSNEQTTTPGQKPVAFCQNCGKPLDDSTVRIVGPAVYCEPCLAARLGGAPAGAPPPAGFRTGVDAGPVWAMPLDPAPIDGGPNPGLATLLGIIPGVGAMYNEQYAKGIVHLMVFAVLISLTNASEIFVLFVFGWIFYMAIEARHTAQARRNGTPLPNPFGLNDIGERLGFGTTWGGVPRPPAAAAPGDPQAHYSTDSAASAGGAPFVAPPQASPWAAPENPAANIPGASFNYTPPGFGGPYTAPIPPYSGPYASYAAPSAFVPPMPGVFPDPLAPQKDRFPAGAVWLIGLGTVFLLTTTGLFEGFPAHALIGLSLIGFAVWIFLRRMTDSGQGLINDGTAGYPIRLLRALRAAVWLALVGIFLLISTFHPGVWRQAWPWFIILAGVMALLERMVYNSAASAYTRNPVAPATPFSAPAASAPYGAAPASSVSAPGPTDTTPTGGN